MNFFAAVYCFVVKTFDFKTRSIRSEFWWASLFELFFALWLDYLYTVPWIVQTEWGLLVSFAYIWLFIASVSLTARRLHDVNQSGWMMLIGLTGIAIPVLIYWFLIRGDREDNDYGPDPLAKPM